MVGWWDKTKLILITTLVEVVVEVEVELGNIRKIIKFSLQPPMSCSGAQFPKGRGVQQRLSQKPAFLLFLGRLH